MAGGLGAARDQARRLPNQCPKERGGGEVLQPPRHRPPPPLPADRRNAGPLALTLLHHRWRGIACDDNGVASFNLVRSHSRFVVSSLVLPVPVPRRVSR